MQISACRNFFNFTHIAVNYFAAKTDIYYEKSEDTGRTANTMTKGLKIQEGQLIQEKRQNDKQRSTKHYTEN
jgi:hypothetical protein